MGMKKKELVLKRYSSHGSYNSSLLLKITILALHVSWSILAYP